MSDLQNELLKRADLIFAKIAETAANVSNFAAEQLPDIAIQFIAYSRATYTAWVVIAILLITFQIYCVKIGMNLLKKEDEMGLPFNIAAFFISFIVVPLLAVNLPKFFMVWFAPKVFLITEIIQLVKG